MPADIIIIPGKPVGKARPRFARNGRAYTPEGTRAYEELVVWSVVRSGCHIREGPVLVTVHAYFPIPASWSKARHRNAVQGLIWPTGKPDLDNIIKAVLDGMTKSGRCWKDDAQVVGIVSRKFYADDPRVIVKVEDLEDGKAPDHRKPDP